MNEINRQPRATTESYHRRVIADAIAEYESNSAPTLATPLKHINDKLDEAGLRQAMGNEIEGVA